VEQHWTGDDGDRPLHTFGRVPVSPDRGHVDLRKNTGSATAREDAGDERIALVPVVLRVARRKQGKDCANVRFRPIADVLATRVIEPSGGRIAIIRAMPQEQ
jgi:hypothetical protein